MTDKNLEQMRQDIDKIDSQITDLFRTRMETSLEIAKYKKEHQIPVLNDNREKEVLHKVSEQIGEPFDGYARLLFNTIFDASRSCQNNFLARRSDSEALSKKSCRGMPGRRRLSLAGGLRKAF